jgi:hypothetical protein
MRGASSNAAAQFLALHNSTLPESHAMEARVAKAEQAVAASGPTDDSIARLEAAVALLERSTGISALLETGTRM